MATPSVFISRDISTTSPFAARLQEAGWQVEGHSLIRLSPLPFRAIPAADFIFFTSRNAVRFFFDNAPKRPDGNMDILPYTRWAAIGPATAKALSPFVGTVDFTGTGDPATTAAAFRINYGHLKRKTVLFPAARNIRQSLIALLSDDFTCVHLEIYDNRPVTDPPFSAADVLVFTSPMNARAYFSRHTLLQNQRVVAIGRSTEATLTELGLPEIHTAAEPTESGLAEAVLGLQP